MTDRFPDYDVLRKRDTLSWNDVTRRVIDRRLAVSRTPRFFDPAEWAALVALCDRVVPQPTDREPVPLAAYVDAKMAEDRGDGYRLAALPPQREAWTTGLAALDDAARTAHGAPFADLAPHRQDALLAAMQKGALNGPAWRGMPSDLFFARRVLHDVVNSYYAHPTAWSEIGWAGPASPRGFVRMDANMRDPWEAAESYPGREAQARRDNRRVV